MCLFGSSDPLAARFGDAVEFMISAEGTQSVKAEIVRLVHGNFNPADPGFMKEHVPFDIPFDLDVRRQYTQNGSCGRVEDPEGHLRLEGAFSLFVFLWPSLSGGRREALPGSWSVCDSAGFDLGINPEEKLEFRVGDGRELDQVTADAPLARKVRVIASAS
jgi:N,N-dimethylformamidase